MISRALVVTLARVQERILAALRQRLLPQDLPPAARPDPQLSRSGPYTLELLKDVFLYRIPFSQLHEFSPVRISVLVPSRGRPDRLRSSLDSVIALAAAPEHVQIVIRCDVDDRSMDGFEFPAGAHLKLIRGDRMRGYSSLHFFYTECALHASAPLLLLWNDDAVMQTKGWDAELWRATAHQRESGRHGFWALANNHWPYAFPVITRSVCERLGAFAGNCYNDAYLFELARACGIEQPVLENIRVQHDMLPTAAGDGQVWRLHHSAFFNDLIAADARVLMGPDRQS